MDLLFDSVSQFFTTHSLQLRIPKSTSFELQRALDEGMYMYGICNHFATTITSYCTRDTIE
jgi:hypothetical protein